MATLPDPKSTLSTDATFKDRALLAPAFRIKLDGREAGREVIADVLEVSFTDDLDNIDAFEFVLHDWDPELRQPRYSSPWTADGTIRKLSDGKTDVPVFEPGARVSLFMGYVEEGELPLVMEGEVVSLTPSFPASGAPTCRVRALDAFQRGLQKVRVEGNYSGTKKAVVDQICRDNDVRVRWSALDEEGAEEADVAVEGVLFDEIKSRADAYGLKMITAPPTAEGETPVLFLAKPTEDESEPVATFVWGANLISFSPVLSAHGQVSRVIARGADPDGDGEGRVEVSRTWSDVGLSPTALGPAGKAPLDAAVRGLVEVIKPADVRTQADAARAALKHLREMARRLITGSGFSVGLPELRAGRRITILGLGARFDGVWRLGQTTHTIGAGGYTTSFQGAKEVLRG